MGCVRMSERGDGGWLFVEITPLETPIKVQLYLDDLSGFQTYIILRCVGLSRRMVNPWSLNERLSTSKEKDLGQTLGFCTSLEDEFLIERKFPNINQKDMEKITTFFHECYHVLQQIDNQH